LNSAIASTDGLNGHRVDARLGRDDAIERRVLVGLALAVGDKRKTDTRNRDTVRALALTEALTVGSAARSVLNARLQNRQRSNVAVVERQLLDAPLLDRLAERRVVGPQGRSLRRHLDPLGCRTYLERKVDTNLLVDVDDHVAPYLCLETLRIDRDIVDSHIDQREGEVTSRSRDYLAAAPGVDIGHA
jgi:hypothetical protein